MREYLHWRQGRAYYRRRVPEDLIPYFQKQEIKRALKTGDKKAALLQCAAEHLRVEKEFYDIREKQRRANDNPDQLSFLSNREMSSLALKWLDQTEQRLFELRVKQLDVLSESDVSQLFIEAEMELQEIIEANQKQDISPGLTEGVKFLNMEGITFVRGSESYRRFGHFMNQAILSFHRNIVEEMRGKNSGHKYRQQDTNGITPISIEDLFKKYLNDPCRELNPKTISSYEFASELLTEIIGKNSMAHMITREDCENVLRLLKRLPSNATKLYPNKSFKEAADFGEREGRKTLSVRSVNKYMQILSSVLAYGISILCAIISISFCREMVFRNLFGTS